MQLIPNSAEIKRHQAMHHVALQTPAGNEFYRLIEKSYGHLMIRSASDNQQVINALKKTTGLDLPTQALSSDANQDFIINWVSPDEYLLLVPEKTEFVVESELRKNIQGHFAIVNVSGGQTVLALSGERAEMILKKSTSYDVELQNFPIGKVVTTIFAKSQVLLRRTAKDSFQCIIRRSFSNYLWQWIVDAGSRT